MKRRVLFISALLAIGSFSKADPPPFGTVVQQWRLRMSGSYAGAGITWVRDSGKFYLMDQGYAGMIRVWNLDPADPESSIAQVPWTFANLGMGTVDIPWGIAWDVDSGCFWISQIVDGDIYGGCYLLRHVWNDSAWVWGGAPGDSWFVGDGSNGGALQCLWTAGMEKNEYTGIYYFTPVHTSPSQMNHIGKFDPYTKTNLGRLPYGDETSERAVTLIPWDSAYILTSSWNSGLVKRDTLGRIVQRADSGANSPADMAVEVPSYPEQDSTVWFYMIGSTSSNYFSKISTGLCWRQLPSANRHSVRPSAVLAPVGAADSGEAVVPTLVVRNSSGVRAENVSVHFTIDDQADRVIFHDSLVVTLAPMSADTVEFRAWTATGRDSMDAIAWTYWQGDSTHQDDTISRRFLVRVRRIQMTITWPLPNDTIEPGQCFLEAELRNQGNVTLTFPFLASIGPHRSDTIWVVNLLAGGSRGVGTDTIDLSPGVYWCTIWTPFGDTAYWFVIRGSIQHDVEVSSIDAPGAAVDTLPFIPRATVRNNCSIAEEFCTLFWIEDTLTETRFYFDTIPVWLPGGQQVALAFRPCTLKVEGQYVASCSAHVVTDQNWLNNALHQTFQVGSGVGIEDHHKQRLAAEIPKPTVVRGMLELPRDMTGQNGDCPSGGGPVPALLLDVAGRKVMDLKPGLNDIRHLAPGIYYLRLVVGDSVTSRKLVKLK
jgi:hypothetical protein